MIMAITTTQELADVPVGEKVYVNDRPYWRHSPDWWSATEDGGPAVRDTHMAGFLSTGSVLSEGEQQVRPGAVAKGRHSFFILTGMEGRFVWGVRLYHPESTSVLRGVVPAYQLRDMNHRETTSWFRDCVYEPTPGEWAGIATTLITSCLTSREELAAAEDARHEAVRDRDRQTEQTASLRRTLREFLQIGEDAVF